MARISDTLLVQLVEDMLVVMDDSGQEILIHRQEIPGFLAACHYLVSHIDPPVPEWTPPDIDPPDIPLAKSGSVRPPV